jgi:hypothetical protein
MSQPNQPPFCAVPVNRLSRRPVAWLWPGRLGLERLVLLDGDPGLGKSLVTLDWCARVSTGRPFPGAVDGREPANALVINGEDGQDTAVAARLDTLGADTGRVFVLHSPHAGGALVLRVPSNLAALAEVLAQTRPLLVVLDPVVAFLDSNVQLSNELSVRRALTPLADLAHEHRCTFVLVRHLNKSDSSRALYRGAHSIAFQAACRSCWLLARDPLHAGRRVLAQVKNNEAPAQPSLALVLVTAEGRPPAVEWLGPHPWSADQLLRAAGRSPRISLALEKAKEFLAAYLKDGPHTSREVWQAAQKERLSQKTLRRAREELAIHFKKLWARGARLSYWLLPGQELPPDLAALHAEQDLEPWLGPMRERYPPPSPLDDL